MFMAKTEIDNQLLIRKLQLKEGDKVADFGCGFSGNFTLLLAKALGDKGKVYAVDILQKALLNIKNLARNAGFENIIPIWSDLEIYNAAKIPNGSCDAVAIVNMLFQAKEHEKVLKEAKRILKDKGLILVSDWKGGIFIGPPPDIRISKNKLKKIGNKLDLTVKDEFEAGPYHYAIVFKK
jgi:ubiquinone/menaquinone biosynthesis C-methylase UbiE